MKKNENQRTMETGIRDTIETANSIVAFYEDVIAHHTEKARALEAENTRLQRLVLESKDLLKAVLSTPTRSLIN